MRIARAFVLAVLVVAAALLATLAAPIERWRSGDLGVAPFEFAPPGEEADPARRLWIDTDAACGSGPRTDPDDCLAIALLAREPTLAIAGISTVFGNAAREEVDRTTMALASRLSAESGRPIPVHAGSAAPITRADSPPATAAHHALAEALEQGPLTLVALGPLTNIADVLDRRPDLRPRVARIVAVMGRRPGHVFHPSEGAGTGTLLGHGPVFRDFNFAGDPGAAARIVSMGLPTTLVPYDAARGIELTASDLDRLAASGEAGAWIAANARPWLAYWNDEVGRAGFSPFDLLAAAYVVEPRHFGCAPARAWVGPDATLSFPFARPTALLVDRHDATPDGAAAAGSALYCGTVDKGLMPDLVERLAADRGRRVAKSGSPVPP